MATQQEQEAMTAFVAASSLEAARSVARRYPLLQHPGALNVLDQLMAAEGQRGNTAAYNQLSTRRQWLAQIQSGR
jgi:hypothetical protein